MDVRPKLVATTGSSYNCTIQESSFGQTDNQGPNTVESWPITKREENNYFKSAQWTADGTTIVTESADNCVRTFIIPPDLLDDRPDAITLTPYSNLGSFEPVYAVAIAPNFNLQDTSTTYLLSSVSDHPIRLTSALAPGLLASYPLINPTTEAFITPHSLAFSSDGQLFITGSDSLLCIFDLSRPGSGPLASLPTIPSKRKQIVGGGVGMKGIISAIGIEPTSRMLAAGTFTRQIGVYSSDGQGECVGIFGLKDNGADLAINGSGVTQLLWSPCGRYLYIAERKSGGIMTYDIRRTGQLLGWLEGRRAMTNQRLRIDTISIDTTGSHDIWAGGTDGSVTVWKNPTFREGGQEPAWTWKAHDDSVTTAAVHKTGGVFATCSGQRHFREEVESVQHDSVPLPTKQTLDNSLRIWSL